MRAEGLISDDEHRPAHFRGVFGRMFLAVFCCCCWVAFCASMFLETQSVALDDTGLSCLFLILLFVVGHHGRSRTSVCRDRFDLEMFGGERWGAFWRQSYKSRVPAIHSLHDVSFIIRMRVQSTRGCVYTHEGRNNS